VIYWWTVGVLNAERAKVDDELGKPDPADLEGSLPSRDEELAAFRAVMGA
jgi:hypothetical protein